MLPLARNWIPLEQVLGELIDNHELPREETTQLVREAIADGAVTLRILAAADRWQELSAEECARVKVDLENGVLVGRKLLPPPVYVTFEDEDPSAEAEPPLTTAPPVTHASEAPLPEWSVRLERIEVNMPQLTHRVRVHLRMRKRAGGRPSEHRWDLVYLEIGRWVWHNGMPDPVAPLIRHLQQFCADQQGREPDEREMRRRVSRALAVIAEPISPVSPRQDP